MPEERKIAASLADAKIGDLVECGASELTPVDDAGVPVADVGQATGIIARESILQWKRLSIQGLLAKRDQLLAELAQVNACLKAVGR